MVKKEKTYQIIYGILVILIAFMFLYGAIYEYKLVNGVISKARENNGTCYVDHLNFICEYREKGINNCFSNYQQFNCSEIGGLNVAK